MRTGAQSQNFNGIPEMLRATSPKIQKFIDGDANLLRACRDASPDTLLVYRAFTGPEQYKDANAHPSAAQYGREYAQMIAQRVGNVRPLYVESENEQTLYIADIGRWNEFTIAFSEECAAHGLLPVVGNFSEGHPEVFAAVGEYVIWPALWEGIAPGLRAAKAAGGALGLHEYGCPTMQQDWSDAKQLGYRCGRHRAVLAALPADLKDMPIIIGEAGIDWLIIGELGGYAHKGGTIEAFISQLAWYESICAPNLLGVCVFGRQMNGEWNEYDVARDAHDDQVFLEFIRRGTVVVPPPVGEAMPTPNELLRFAWLSIGVAFNPSAALQKKADEWKLGRPVGDELYWTSENKKQYVTQGFDKAFLTVEKDQWDAALPYDWQTGELYVAPVAPPPVIGGLQPFVFPDILSAAGARGVEGSPIAGAPFYRLAPKAVVIVGVSAFCVVNVFDKNGQPAIGVQVCNVRPGDGNKGEVQETKGDGRAQFNYGPGAAFSTPGSGPLTVFIAEGATRDEDTHVVTWDRIVSDTVRSLGDMDGPHKEIYMQFAQQI